MTKVSWELTRHRTDFWITSAVLRGRWDTLLFRFHLKKVGDVGVPSWRITHGA